MEVIVDTSKGVYKERIVRCKECKYKQQCRKAVEHITHELASVTIGSKSVDFCSYGERKESE